MSFRWGLVLLVGLVWVGSARAQETHRNRWNPVELQLVGPMQSVLIDCGKIGSTRIGLELLPGEKRELQVPLPQPPGFVDASADVSISGGGTVGWPRELGLEPEARGGASSLPLPVIPNAVPILPISGLLGLAGLVLLLFFLRGRPMVLAGVSMGGAVLLFAQIGWTSSQDGGLVRIIEMRGAAPWGVLDSAMDSMEHKPGQRIWLSVKPVASPLVWEVNERDGGWSMVAHSKGALLRKRYSELPGMRTLDAELNALGNLEQVWVREASGLWTSRGPWALGLELPSTVIEGPGPPSWLVAALPQGPTIWVARFAPGVRPLGGGNPATETWLRVRLDA